jgi:hypothetical protein
MDRWKAGEEVTASVLNLIANFHPHLTDICDGIVVIFREKASQKGGKPILGKTSKAPALITLLGEKKYEFILELGADTWIQLTPEQQNALLDHLLCHIGGEEDEKTAEMKYHLRNPDVYYFSEELDRNGHWRPVLETKDSEDSEDSDESPF